VNDLRTEVLRRVAALPDAEAILASAQGPHVTHPFTETSYLLMQLAFSGAITKTEADRLLALQARAMPNLHLYQITAPRVFGDNWGQKHLGQIAPSLLPASADLDPGFCGQYDRYDRNSGARVELKATRVVEDGVNASLADKAVSSTTDQAYCLYFKQVKPDCCDVFVLMAVFADIIRYWVIPSGAMGSLSFYRDKLHRKGSGSGQVTISSRALPEIAHFEVPADQVGAAVGAAHEGPANPPSIKAKVAIQPVLPGL
jgi:hypothetical protein